MDEKTLELYFFKYLKNVRKVKDSTVKHYQEALLYISKYLAKKGVLEESIYEIEDLEQLEVIKNSLLQDKDFVELDNRGHRMYTAGLNNYLKFAHGEGLEVLKDDATVMDIAVKAPKATTISLVRYDRSSIKTKQALEIAEYKCEFDESHKTFIAEKTEKPYMEGHHAVPMKFQEQFDVSLDVYANIVCLCPICHRLIHYGVPREKDAVLNKLYAERSNRLDTCGIRVSKEEFKSFVL